MDRNDKDTCSDADLAHGQVATGPLPADTLERVAAAGGFSSADNQTEFAGF